MLSLTLVASFTARSNLVTHCSKSSMSEQKSLQMMLDAALSVRGAACAACAACACRRWSSSSADMMDNGRKIELQHCTMVLSPQSQGQVITLLKRRKGGEGGDKLVTCPHGTLRSRFP